MFCRVLDPTTELHLQLHLPLVLNRLLVILESFESTFRIHVFWRIGRESQSSLAQYSCQVNQG